MSTTLRRLIITGLVSFMVLVVFLSGVHSQDKTPAKTAAPAKTKTEAPAKTAAPDKTAAPVGHKKISLSDLKTKGAGAGTTIGMRFQSLLGMVFLVGVCVLMSNNRKKISWRLVAWGLGLQLMLGILVMVPFPGLGYPLLRPLFEMVNTLFMELMGFTTHGASFLFGNLSKVNNVAVGPGGPFGPVQSKGNVAEIGAYFAFAVLPTIIFFSSFMAVLYHLGFMQWLVKGVATVMQKTMGTSGSETLSAAGNIFVGQTEAPLLVRPFVLGMTESELMAVMTGGFATVAGGVMAAYVGMLHSHFPDIAGHLLSASIMSAPAALVCAKLMIPEPVPEKSETYGELKVELKKVDTNVIDAAARGAGDGLKLAFNVGAMLLAFIALIAMFNAMLNWGSNRVADVYYGDTWSERVSDSNKWLSDVQASAEPSEKELSALRDRFKELAREALGIGLAAEFDAVVDLNRKEPATRDARGAIHLGPSSLDPKKPGLIGITPDEQTLSPFRGRISTKEDMGAEGTWRALNFQMILGWLLAPLAWLMGVPWVDASTIGQLIGIKTVLNEFVAYMELSSLLASGAIQHPRSVVIVTYALCGFANFASIAIQIGGIGGIAPERTHDLAKLGMRAMIAGTIAALLTATVAGMLI